MVLQLSYSVAAIAATIASKGIAFLGREPTATVASLSNYFFSFFWGECFSIF